MATGHNHSGIRLSAREVDEALSHPRMVREMNRPWKLDTDHDLPYLAGYSTNDIHRYVDQHFHAKGSPVGTILIRGKLVNCLPWLVGDPKKSGIYKCGHEGVEKCGIDVFGWSYPHAHEVATAAERRILLSILGPGWWLPYSKTVEPYIKKDEHEKLVRVPEDLDMHPYEAKPVNKVLLFHMRKAMKAGHGKCDCTDRLAA